MKASDAPRIQTLADKLARLDIMADAVQANQSAPSEEKPWPPRVFIDIGGADFELDAGFTDAAVEACLPLIAVERARVVAALQELGIELAQDARGRDVPAV